MSKVKSNRILLLIFFTIGIILSIISMILFVAFCLLPIAKVLAGAL